MFRHLFNRDIATGTPEDVVRAGAEAYRVTGGASEIFFKYARYQMLRGALLDLCRLNDRNDQENLTLARMLKLTDFSKALRLRGHAEQSQKEAYDLVHQSEGIWWLRNKKITHLDFDVAAGTGPDHDPEIIDAADEAIRWVVDFARVLTASREGKPYEPPSARDEEVTEARASVERLVRVLGLGLKYEPHNPISA
ncbi:MAG: hypothetical protein EXS08_12715 [Planctomycetes bacterium]|nr:hypothetical protein [Planctomycetota bacterium]